MQWDLGLQGLAVLGVMAIGFGVIAQLMFWNRTTWWVGLVSFVAFFAAGLFISEGLFGWATAADLQPNVDGLSFDEVLLGYAIGIPVLLIAWYLQRRARSHRPMMP